MVHQPLPQEKMLLHAVTIVSCKLHCTIFVYIYRFKHVKTICRQSKKRLASNDSSGRMLVAGVESPLQTAMDLHTVKSILGIGKYEHDSWYFDGQSLGRCQFTLQSQVWSIIMRCWNGLTLVWSRVAWVRSPASVCEVVSPWKHTNASHKLHRKRTEKMWITGCFIGRIFYFCVSTFFQLRTERWPQFWSAIEKQPGREAISTPEAATLEFSGHFDLEGCSHNFLPPVDHFASQATHPVSSGFMSTPKGWIV